ncbi:MAG: LytTR family transcriptional regulator DNA-binding domain-containing protein [Sphingomonas bacterium]|nr:LytTR family transcriptional regulator DNA-binding domain-containing protein [Sphingomonas bacterium]
MDGYELPLDDARNGRGNQLPTLREWVIELVVMVAVGVALAALGPFGSFAIGSFGARLAYWIPAALIGYAIFRPITLAALLIARRLDLPELAAAIIGTLVAAIPGTFAIAYLGGYRLGNTPSFDQLFQLYVQVGVIGVIVMLMFFLLGDGSTRAVEPVPGTVPAIRHSAEPAPAPFLDRLPGAWADRLVALEMEDHYVRAHGPDSSALLLLRMRDAEAELAGIDGMRIHRSWWVARRSVENVVRDGRGYKLRLTNGLEAPVARDRIAALRAAGWLA